MTRGVYIRTKENCRNISEAKKRDPRVIERCRQLAAAQRGNPGTPHSEESRLKMSEATKGEGNHFFGKLHTEKSRHKMSEAHKGEGHHNFGKRLSEEACKKLSRAHIGIQAGEKHPLFGKHHSEESLKRMSEAHKGTHPTRESRRKTSEAMKGEKGPNWKGGISFEPYCPKFNTDFKERNRAFFDYICPECLTPQNGVKLSVHHVNFVKMSCCDNTPPLFVPLCRSCHTKTNFNRPYWEAYFTNMIEGYYEGKCYFTPEEMACRS